MPIKRAKHSDGGFTLIELLVSIVVLGVIAFPLTNVVIDYLLNSAQVTARLTESHDEQIAAAYWQQDVSSMGIRANYDPLTQTYPYASSVNVAFPCGTVPGTQLVTLAWDRYDSSGNAKQVTVAYSVDSSGSGLVRSSCDGSVPTSTATLTHDLNGTPTCDFGSGAGACSAGSGAPMSIKMTLNISDPTGKGQPYSITLQGQRRQTT